MRSAWEKGGPCSLPELWARRGKAYPGRFLLSFACLGLMDTAIAAAEDSRVGEI